MNLHEKISAVLDEEDGINKTTGSRDMLLEVLDKVIAAARGYEALEALDLMRSLEEFTFGEETNALLRKATHALEIFDCEAAADALSSFVEKGRAE